MTVGFTWQALNALVFFYRDVCGRGEIDLGVKMKKAEQRQHCVLSRDELMGLVEKLEERYKTPALLQYGAGLRLTELVQLRVKDVDLERGRVKGYASRDLGGCSRVTGDFTWGGRQGSRVKRLRLTRLKRAKLRRSTPTRRRSEMVRGCGVRWIGWERRGFDWGLMEVELLPAVGHCETLLSRPAARRGSCDWG